MMMRWIIILFLISTGPLRAQEKIQTDRPDQSESPYVLPKKNFQGEIGLQLENDESLRTIFYPTALWKYGLVKRVELRLFTDFISQETPLLIPIGNDINTGLLPIRIGTKIGLWEQKGIRPKTSFLIQSGIPKFATKAFEESKWSPRFRFAMLNSLSDKIDLSYNVGGEWDGEDDDPKWLYTISPSFELSDKMDAFIEVYGFFGKSDPQHSLDAGFSYLLSDNMQLDLAAGFGLSKSAGDSFITMGFSFRLN